VKVLNKNKILIEKPEQKEVLITLGRDIRLTEIMSEYVKSVYKLSTNSTMTENVLKQVLLKEGETLTEEQEAAIKDYMQALNGDNFLDTISTFSTTLINTKVQVFAELLSEYSSTGEMTKMVLPTHLLDDPKYSEPEVREEMDSIFNFVSDRFFELLSKQESAGKKQKPKKKVTR
jgi:hypothetical protein